jgi:hypothetical protein
MSFAYIALAVLTALMVAASGMLKVRRDPKVTRVIHDVVGVSLKFFPFLAACEFAGAVGLLGGIVWRPLGLAASWDSCFTFLARSLGTCGWVILKDLAQPLSCSSLLRRASSCE